MKLLSCPSLRLPRLRRAILALLGALGSILLLHRAAGQTAADIMGPDGVVYPDFRSAGVPGGIPPTLTVQRDISFYSYSHSDTAQAIEDAAAYAASQPGGGVVTIPAGPYYLHRPVFIRANNVVLRGSGSATKLYFDYQSGPADKDVIWYRPGIGGGSTTIDPNSWLEIHADRKTSAGLDLQWLTITTSSGVRIAPATTIIPPPTPPTIISTYGEFSLTTTGAAVLAATGAGSNKVLVATAHYSDGTTITKNITVSVASSGGTIADIPNQIAAINFLGTGIAGSATMRLTAAAARGANQLFLTSAATLAANDYIELIAHNTTAWSTNFLHNACTTDIMRRYIYKVQSVAGNTVTLTQPLRLDYPITEGAENNVSEVKKLVPLTGGGVENLYLEQTRNIWTSGIMFTNAVGCWVKGVTVEKAGRHAVYSSKAKWCEIRNCTFDDAWWKGGGGSAYVGWDRSYDCLMDTVTSTRMRHGPLVQWSAAGNVIRNSYFESDAQWHAGWANENLFENNTILPSTDNGSDMGNGSYGQGMFSSAPEDTFHGPNGPRNVVYRNDVSSDVSAVWLGGQNRGWRFVGNRFSSVYGGSDTDGNELDHTGAGIYAKDGSTDHIIQNNIFALKHGSTGVWTKTADATGIQVVDNQFFGTLSANVDVWGGAAGLADETPNAFVDTLDKSLWVFNNPGFESGSLAPYWDASTDPAGVSTLKSGTGAHSGSWYLNVTAPSSGSGSSVYSPAFAVTPGHGYLARFYARVNSGARNLAVYLKFQDVDGHDVGVAPLTLIAASTGFWAHYNVHGTAPVNAVSAKLRIHSFSNAACSMDFDDFAFGEVPFTLADPGFESGSFGPDDAHWRNNNALSSIVAGISRNGDATKVLHISDNSGTAGASLTSRRFSANFNSTYEVRFWAQITSTVAGVGVALNFLDAQGNVINIGAQGDRDIPLTDNPNTLPVKNNPGLKNRWRQYVVRAVAPSNAAQVAIWIHSDVAGGTATIPITADLDDFVLSEIPPALLPLVAGQRPVLVPSLLDWQLHPQYPLDDASFESGNLNNWVQNEDTTVNKASFNTVISTDAHTGTHCLLVTDTDSAWGSTLASQRWPVVPGKSYKAGFWAKMVSGTGGVAVYIRFYDAAGNRLLGSDTLAEVPSTATAWTFYPVPTAVAPSGAAPAATAEVWIHSYGSSSNVHCKFDDFTFSPIL